MTPGAPAGSPLPPAPQSLVLPMRAVLRASVAFTAVALPLGAVVGYVVAGAPGVWGALIGLGLPLVFFTFTVAVSLATARLHPGQLGMAVLATWLIKVIGLIAALVILKGMDFYSKPVLFGGIVVGTIGYLVMEAMIVARTKVLYVETEFAPQ